MSVSVALCGDRHVLPGLAITARSALENASCPLDIHVISAGLSDDDKKKLRSSWRHPNCGVVEFVDISKRTISGFRSTAYLKSKAAYARFFIAEMFPNVNRCIYLDADLMVLRDLKEAFQLDLGGNIAGAVLDISTRRQPTNPETKARLGLRDERNYFNSGFMIMDCDAWRREDIAGRLVQISHERFDTLSSQDQDALNILLEDRVLLLDLIWNTVQYEKPNPLSGNVVHLIGTIKPWHSGYKEKWKKWDDPYYRDVIFKTFSDLLSRTEFRDHRSSWISETIYSKIPTMDMIAGKIRRLMVSG